MTRWLGALIALIVATLVLSIAEAPAHAQRSRRAHHARRTRAHRPRRHHHRRVRTIAASERVDMDFAAELAEHEAPPPMEMSDLAAIHARSEAARHSALDPELTGRARPALDPELARVATPRERGRFSPLTARVAFRLFDRDLSYLGYQAGPVTPYSLPIGPAVAVAVDYYPAAHVVNDAWAHLGIAWSVVQSFAVQSAGPNAVTYPTNAYAWQLGARYRVPVDGAGGEVAFEAGGGQQGFAVQRGALQSPAPEGVPVTRYDYLRVAASARFTIDDAAIGGRIGYLPVLSVGELASARYFGNAEAHGFEAGVDFTYRLGLGFELLAEVDARLFVLSFAPSDTAAALAQGAVDRTLGASLGLRWTMPAESAL